MRVGWLAALTLALVAMAGVALWVYPTPEQAPPKVGLVLNDPRAFQGYTLLAPLTSTKTYLIDIRGRVVRTWESDCKPGWGAYLLENGNLLRPGQLGLAAVAFGGGPGSAGRVQEFTWNGELIWDYRLYDDKQLSHHDVLKLPNRNVLIIVWDKKTAKQAIAAGRRPELAAGHRPELLPALGPSQAEPYLLADSLLEVQPTGETTGEVVWEWHVWDHLVQDFDKSKANYGNVAQHPELVDINAGRNALGPIMATKEVADKLRSIGYVGSTPAGGTSRLANPDWTHFNSVAYHAGFDQIAISVLGFNEIWIIDHSTTAAEAAGHRGGRSGKGGDLLYRWGNPGAYRAGAETDQRLFAQHDAEWIPPGSPGEGHLLVFNNGHGRPDGSYSSVDEIVLPVDKSGHYSRPRGAAFGPRASLWSYAAATKSDFFSPVISGAQRLPNGNTLICSGMQGTLFEVTADREIVWKYVNPVKGEPDLSGLFSIPAVGAAESVFRAYRFAPDYPGLAGKNLEPGEPLEQLPSSKTDRTQVK